MPDGPQPDRGPVAVALVRRRDDGGPPRTLGWTMAEPIPHPLPEPVIELVAQRFRVLSEPMRIRLLEALRDGEATVQELTSALGATQQNVSKHLGVLHGAGIVQRRKDGTFVRYSVADPGVYALCELVCGDLQRQATSLGELLQGRAAG